MAAEEDAAAAEGEDAVEKDEARGGNMCGWEQREAALVSRASVFFVASQSVDLVQAHLLPALTLTHQIILITNEAAWWGDGGGGGRQGRRPAFSQWDSVNFRYRWTVSGESPPSDSPPSATSANHGTFNKVQRWFARGLSFENRRFSAYLLYWYKIGSTDAGVAECRRYPLRFRHASMLPFDASSPKVHVSIYSICIEYIYCNGIFIIYIPSSWPQAKKAQARSMATALFLYEQQHQEEEGEAGGGKVGGAADGCLSQLSTLCVRYTHTSALRGFSTCALSVSGPEMGGGCHALPAGRGTATAKVRRRALREVRRRRGKGKGKRRRRRRRGGVQNGA